MTMTVISSGEQVDPSGDSDVWRHSWSRANAALLDNLEDLEDG